MTINDPDSQVQQIRIFLNGSVFELSENVSCDVRVIHEVCEGAELFSLEKLPVENSTYCSSTINRMNEIVINCDGEKLNPHGAEMGIFVTDCFDNCTDSIYVVGKLFDWKTRRKMFFFFVFCVFICWLDFNNCIWNTWP